MIGVFIDTFVVLTMTALVVISTLYAGNGPLAGGAAEGIDQSNMAQLAFSSVFGEGLGSIFVAVCLLFLRLFHHPQLELLWQAQRGLSLRQASHCRLLGAWGGVHLLGLVSVQ